MDGYLGQYALGDTVNIPIGIKVADVPMDPTDNPTFRVYEAATVLTNGTGTLSQMETGTVTDATNASPIVITSNGHGLKTGNVVAITGVGGNTNANTTAVITRINDNTFSLNGIAGNSAYTAGGTWHLKGAYKLTLTLSSGNGFEIGKTYKVRVDWNNLGTAYVAYFYFSVT